ncbi:D-arabinono-1,4-lactone oxidase [Streptomyces malaysiensis]|uniref:FAD-linked oxidoreductase n=1 Tax=Streptomyces malaysiensis TaxID=92644 RepID=A0A7X6AU55_STRMQ|nr:D-arabinono-1,4-lactone oxidase [Streptomyces malaysiensis]NIY62270.1 FAD-linked oxidoreductase [Streptomyces malaysiensis]
MQLSNGGQTWSNWAGNQTSTVQEIQYPDSIDEVAIAVSRIAASGGHIRVAGSGHSFTPLVNTSGTVMDLRRLPAEAAVDSAASTARVSGHMRLSEVGRELWERGFSLANQGDVDVQTLAGALATGTKGSGTRHGTMSSRVRGMGLITGAGEHVEITEADPRLLHAAQVALGLLGVVTHVDLSVVPRYRLREDNAVMSVDELLETWEEAKDGYHHFSFWWMPTSSSSKIYGLPPIPADHAYVKMLTAESAEGGTTVIGGAGARSVPAHLIYPDTELGDPFYELEYVVDATDDKETFLQLRDLMQRGFPQETTPLQVRWQARDEAYLSPQYRRDSISLSVSGMPGTDYVPFLQAVDRQLRGCDARPHWGKLHFLDRGTVKRLYPALDDFRAVRRSLDPDGVFLNEHLSELLG